MQTHLICIGAPREGQPWRTPGNMLYALLSHKIGTEERVNILEHKFGFRDLDFIHEKGEEYMNAATEFWEAVNQYEREIDSANAEISDLRKNQRKSDSKIACFADGYARMVIDEVLKKHCSLADALDSLGIAKLVRPDVEQAVRDACAADPDLSARLGSLL